MGNSPTVRSGPIHLLTHEFLPFTGGIGVYVEETARALAQAGADLTVWAPNYGQPLEDRLPFRVRRIPMRGKQDWLCRLQLAKALRREFPSGRIPGTVVLAEPGPIRLWMYSRFLNLPKPDRLVVLLHGSEIRGLARLVHRRQLFRQLLCSADCVGVVSSAVGELALRLCPDLQGRLVRVPGAVRSAWQELPPVPRQLDPKALEVLQVARIHPRKGQHALLRAVALLPDDLRQAVRVRLVGPVARPAYAASLERFARDYALPVQFEGTLSEGALKAAYASASLLVLPSQPFRSSVEGLGLALLEAQHFGCPVVATDIGGVAEALQDQQSGFLVPPGDPQTLASALARILQDPALAEALGLAGARFVRGAFSWKTNIRRLGLV